MQADSQQDETRSPRYYRIYQSLLSEIQQGSLKPGDLLPSEMSISQSHGVAPGTARKAIDMLVDRGWVERQHGRGTFVRRADFSHSLARFFRLTDREGVQLHPKSELIGIRELPAPADIARHLEVAERSPLIEIERVRRVDELALLHEVIYLPGERFSPLLNLPTEEWGDLLYPLYERACAEIVFRATDTLCAGPAPEGAARHLGLEPGTQVIEIARLARGYDEKPLEWRLSRGRLDLFHYSFDIR
ncbi:GntR family transcriptional regulator [Halomonas sp. HP20-15]|uniref:GntR family transcriptional regulator n=1 Tax=Halomonas sp. HP20-15 TaxID=3085901 RepID=UPI002980E8D3|nr:GntR family transcriptional regulator [Halomonas sp. HP20-15]MDW5377287.1 GntR family transcriptional regulator [Halomonas sp. HP20-15]